MLFGRASEGLATESFLCDILLRGCEDTSHFRLQVAYFLKVRK